MSSDIQFELVSKDSEPVLFANLSAIGEAVTSARFDTNELYIARFRNQRIGKILPEKN